MTEYEYEDTDDGRRVLADGEELGVVAYPIKKPDDRISELILEKAGFSEDEIDALTAIFGLDSVDDGEDESDSEQS